jgi:hypothetical protein
MKSQPCMLVFVIIAAVGLLPRWTAGAEEGAGRWPAAKANAWLDRHGWLFGCNFIPSTAVNQLEMWQAETFDTITIDRELGYAESLGMNSVRVFLHDLLWKQDSTDFIQRLDKFLEIADRHHIGAVFVLFDGCWHPVPKLGKQPAPILFTHNSGWVQSPGRDVLLHPEKYPRLKEYTIGMLRRFGKDRRVQVWDVWNEPDNLNENANGKLELKNKREFVGPLLLQVFSWAREADPSQPLTSAVWFSGKWGDMEGLTPIERIQLGNSDIVSFHCYDKAETLSQRMADLKWLDRPVICTEFMARPIGSTFDPQLGLMKKARVGAYCWGLVSGKTQTIYPWDSWTVKYTGEPPLWFHDIFRRDGSPYRVQEVDYIRRVVEKAAVQ